MDVLHREAWHNLSAGGGGGNGVKQCKIARQTVAVLRNFASQGSIKSVSDKI